MKIPTIISGPPASGKSWTAIGIRNQYKKKRVLDLIPALIERKFCSIPATLKLYKKYALVIIDECKAMEIKPLYEKLVTPIRKEGIAFNVIKCPLAFVFITQETIYQDEYQDFHVINCNNRQLFSP